MSWLLLPLRSTTKMESSNDPKQVKFILDLNADTMFLDLRVKETRDEIGHWTRYSMAQAKQHGDGLAAYAMLFPGWMMTLFFKHRLGLPDSRRASAVQVDVHPLDARHQDGGVDFGQVRRPA